MMIRIISYSQFIYLLFAILLLANSALANPWADEVIFVEYGPMAGFGQAFFPDNVLGPPDSTATAIIPSATPEELLALGSGGSIILFFSGGISNGAGPDFTIFENPFYVSGQEDNVFIEAGIVSASFDGENWIEFPYNTETYSGLAGVTPTNGNANPLNPSVSGGDAFDLEDISLEFAHYIKITDADTLVEDDGDSFDLDAVAVINSGYESNLGDVSSRLISEFEIKAWPNPFNRVINISLPDGNQAGYKLNIFNILGHEVHSSKISGNLFSWEANELPSGYYFLVLSNSGKQLAVKKILLSK